MTRASLNVLIAGAHAGILAQDDAGALSFRYAREYRGTPLSSAMPLSTREYRDKAVRPFLWGLLPEDPATRKHIASKEGISPNNPFALLAAIGLDCPGAVQFCQSDFDAHREERLIPLSEADIARRLSASLTEDSSWIAQNEHWSLGGQQSKFALRKEGDTWYSCQGAAATTHILKSGVRGLAHQALNEYVCMRVAAECGIDAAKVEYREFHGDEGTEPAIIIQRYDRLLSNGSVLRLHQEDLCQALGCLPDNKYAMYGGPTCADALGFLLTTGSAAQANAASFLQMSFFNYLIAGTDAHAKNFSVMLSADGAHRLAPLYDAASIAPYIEPVQWKVKPPKLAMSLGGENRIGHLSCNNFARMVARCGLEQVGITPEGCAALLLHYANEIPQKLSDVFDNLEETQSAAAAQELRDHMEEPISQLCAKTKTRLLA